MPSSLSMRERDLRERDLITTYSRTAQVAGEALLLSYISSSLTFSTETLSCSSPAFTDFMDGS